MWGPGCCRPPRLKTLPSAIAQPAKARRLGRLGCRVQVRASRSKASKAVTGSLPWRPPANGIGAPGRPPRGPGRLFLFQVAEPLPLPTPATHTQLSAHQSTDQPQRSLGTGVWFSSLSRTTRGQSLRATLAQTNKTSLVPPSQTKLDPSQPIGISAFGLQANFPHPQVLTQDIDLVPFQEGGGPVAGCGHRGQRKPAVPAGFIHPNLGLGGCVRAHSPQCIHHTICREKSNTDYPWAWPQHSTLTTALVRPGGGLGHTYLWYPSLAAETLLPAWSGGWES